VYGTTYAGGDHTYCADGCGTVFANGGTLYQFGRVKKTDGAHPMGGFGDVVFLYGTTAAGGLGCANGPYGNGCGTFYVVDTQGKERVIYRFKGGSDGQAPSAYPIAISSGSIFGTTKLGGDASCPGSGGLGCGTVYEITSSGKEHVVYAFHGGTDGAYPQSTLIGGRNGFYGTTASGGGHCPSTGGCRTIFAITAYGAEKIIHSFKGGDDGDGPVTGLAGYNGRLYGMTRYGGDKGCGSSGRGCGTIYQIETYSRERVVYRFKGGTDGANPAADLSTFNTGIYGTTEFGGRYNKGTVFYFAPPHEQVLHAFQGNPDGAYPASNFTITYAESPLFGTTKAGGTGCSSSGGCGTLFELPQR
jgi:hypothetical protein